MEVQEKRYANIKDPVVIKALKLLEDSGTDDLDEPGWKIVEKPQNLLMANGIGEVYLSMLIRMGCVVKTGGKGELAIYKVPKPEDRTLPDWKHKKRDSSLSSVLRVDGKRRLDHKEIMERLKRMATYWDGKKYIINISQIAEDLGVSATIFTTLQRNNFIKPISVNADVRRRFRNAKINIHYATKAIYQICDEETAASLPEVEKRPFYTPPKPVVNRVPEIRRETPPTEPIIRSDTPASTGVAVFIDLPNAVSNFPVVNRFLFEKILELAQKYGPVNLAFVFADFSRQSLPVRLDVMGAGLIAVDCPSTQSGDEQNFHESVDSVMQDMIYRTWEAAPGIDTYLLVTADNDFVPIINRLKMRKKKIILAYPTPRVATTLKRIVDDFIVIEQSELKKTLDDLSELLQSPPQLIEKSRGDEKKEFALKCLIETANMFNDLLTSGRRVGIGYIIDHIWSTKFQKDERLRYTDCSDLVLILKRAGIILKVDDPSSNSTTYYTLDWNNEFVRYWLKRSSKNVRTNGS